MQIRILVVLQVSAHTSILRKNRQRLWDSQGGSVHRRTHVGILNVSRRVHGAGSENKYASGVEPGAKFLQHLGLRRNWYVPDTVPARDEVVLPGQLLFADVRMIEGNRWISLFRESDHPF